MTTKPARVRVYVTLFDGKQAVSWRYIHADWPCTLDEVFERAMALMSDEPYASQNVWDTLHVRIGEAVKMGPR